jgi:AraC-like DNA-binding protein
MIPSGSMHLVFRLSEQPICIFKALEDIQGEVFPNGAVAGMRSAYYIKDVAHNACTIGVGLRPGACQALFGVPANEIAHRHVAVEDLCGKEALLLVERLEELNGLDRRLSLLESFLTSRAPCVSVIHPAIAHALNRLSRTSDVGSVVAETGFSHRHFVQLFRQTVGINPRVYTRLLRFQKTLRKGVDKTAGRWIDIALEAGYADQAHFNREFRELAGISPSEYLLNRYGKSHHVRV